MRRDRWFLFLAIAIVIGFILFNSFSGLWGKRAIFGLGGEEAPMTEREKLRAENDRLKAELAALSQFKSQLSGEIKGRPAFVFSRYPFNIKNEIMVSAGKDQNIKVGQIVMFRGYFIGKVKAVYSNSSLVETIFDSRLETAVRVGNSAIDALLNGGDEPHLSLIPKNSSISVGDIVYTAAQDIPYGLPIAQVREYRMKDGAPFGEAILRFGYSPREINLIEILE